MGIGIDIREKGSLSEISDVLKILRKKYQADVLFLEAEKDVLMRRFRETRRPHPLGGTIDEAIYAEKERLAPLKEVADRVVETSSFTPHQLRQLIATFYGIQTGKEAMTITIISFGFKFGAPQNIDLLFDVRFLPNPHFVPGLRDLSGRNKKVADFVFSHPATKQFMRKVEDLLDFLIPHYIREGKSYISIAFGCTGGRHRSPAIVEEIARFMTKKNLDRHIIHRDS